MFPFDIEYWSHFTIVLFTHTFILPIYTAPSDYTITEGSLSISEEDSVQCVSIAIVNDSEDEQDQECFLFDISTDYTDTLLLENIQATICIEDDDGIC